MTTIDRITSTTSPPSGPVDPGRIGSGAGATSPPAAGPGKGVGSSFATELIAAGRERDVNLSGHALRRLEQRRQSVGNRGRRPEPDRAEEGAGVGEGSVRRQRRAAGRPVGPGGKGQPDPHGDHTFEPSGDNGFGYDPVFYFPEHNKTMAELPSEVKNKVSHRARAAQKALVILREMERTGIVS